MRTRVLLAGLLTLSLSLPAYSEDDYDLSTSTPAQAPRKQLSEHRPRKGPAKQLQNIERTIKRTIKKTSPNPKVQKSSPSPMPPNAPDMPKAPQMPPTPTGTERFLGAVAKVMTKSWGPNIFVWLPAISTDPNTGPTMGVLPVLVLADTESHHIRHLLAPSYTYNSLFGQTGTMRYYWYPTDASQLFAVGSLSERTNREIKVRYENPALLDGGMYFRGEVHYNVKGSNRFFGPGPESHPGDESGYTSKEALGKLQVGFNFFHYWRASFGHRLQRTTTDTNIIPNIADMTARFAGTPGLGTQNTSSSEFRLLFDSRDQPITPSKGSSGEIFVEKTSLAGGSDSDYLRYGIEGKRFFLWNNPKHVTLIHGLYEWVNGSHIPFYELASLGGRNSLRGYGDGRFVDRGRVVMNVEHRITMASLSLMGIETNFEVAPFFDLGTVFPVISKVERKNLRPVYGAAFRAAVKPNVVGDVELGVGKEGLAVFVDINYPF